MCSVGTHTGRSGLYVSQVHGRRSKEHEVRNAWAGNWEMYGREGGDGKDKVGEGTKGRMDGI